VTTLDSGTRPMMNDVVAAVREATAAPSKRPLSSGFSLITASPGERILAPLIGLYLGFAVVRLPEVFPQVDVPHLPMILMLVFLGMLLLAIPPDGWKLAWAASRPMQLVSRLVAIAFITAPLGIWPSGSYDELKQKYIICVVVFFGCLMFLRDRRALRVAVSIYVLSVAAVSAQVLHSYDPTAVVYNEDGDPIDPDVVASHPDLYRLKAVGASLDPNDFGAVICTAFPLALWLSVGSLGRRVLWGGVALLLIAGVVPTQSRGSELGLIAATIVILGVGARGWRRWLSFAMVAGAAAIFLMMATGLGAGGRFSDFSEDDYNINGSDGRWFFWRQGFIWMLKRPWGYGLENFPAYFGIMNGPERAAHSTWVQYGMELGVAGLVTFVMICWALIHGLRALRKTALEWRDRHPAAREEGSLAGHMLALMAGLLVSSTFLSNAYYPLLYMSLGLSGATLLGTPLRSTVTAPAAGAPGPPATGRRRRSFPGTAANR
jgi:hypothetical protein